MNPTMWIFLIVIFLCMTLTKQMKKGLLGTLSGKFEDLSLGKEQPRSSSNTSEEKTCEMWIVADEFSLSDFNINLKRARELFKEGKLNKTNSTISVWSITYGLSITNRDETSPFWPNDLCILFGQTREIKKQKITPSNPVFNCPAWLKLSGYGDSPKENKMIAERQRNEKVYNHFSHCTQDFALFLNQNYKDELKKVNKFCYFRLGFREMLKPVSFSICRVDL